MTIETAKQVAEELQDTTIASPPRGLGGLGKLPSKFSEVANPPACVVPTEKLTPERLEDIVNSISPSDMGGRHVILQRKAIEQQRAGHLSNAITLQRQAIRVTPVEIYSRQGRNRLYLSRLLAEIGEFGEAEKFYSSGLSRIKLEQTGSICRTRDKIWIYRTSAAVAYSKGDLKAAETDLQIALQSWKETWRNADSVCITTISDNAEILLDQARVIFWQGRFVEAETLAREAHKLSRKIRPQASLLLSEIYFESGRYTDSLRLALSAIALLDGLCVPSDAYQRARGHAAAARAYIGLERWQDAAEIYMRLEQMLATDETLWMTRFKNDLSRGIALLRTENAAEAFSVFEARAVATEARLGAENYLALEAQAMVAVAQTELGQYSQALKRMRRVFFKMVERWQERSGDSVRFVGRLSRMRMIGEAYIRLLLDEERGGTVSNQNRIAESFQVADAITTRRVQQALVESTARYLSDDLAHQELIRQQQDLSKRIIGLKHRLKIASSASEVSSTSLQQLRDQIRQAEDANVSLKRQIAELVPEYAALINPKATKMLEAQRMLSEDEALIIIFSGQNRLFVWALSKQGPAKASVVPIQRAELTRNVETLRQALSPDADTLGDIPVYDLALGYRLYRLLLQPVREIWKGRKRILIVADGPLGALPFAVLPTLEVELVSDQDTLFDGYRNVPWLAREVSISRVPSANALQALRNSPTEQGKSHPFIGFGDPRFDPTTEGTAATDNRSSMRGGDPKGKSLQLRSLPKTRTSNTADLSSLPPLPDTADEVLAIARTLGAKLEQDVFLDMSASERNVNSLNDRGKLSQYRTISFATHGLVPGDLDGLDKPALALAGPTLGDEALGYDGLLTSDEILGLRLNADWAVLSACNTAAGDSVGTEAISGLGSAFFYAGAKAILVSNWPVHSDATRSLMIKTFEHYADKGNQGRAEALQAAMLQLIDRGGLTIDDQMVFSYAHPIFWAPFVIVGDGG